LQKPIFVSASFYFKLKACWNQLGFCTATDRVYSRCGFCNFL